MTGIEKFLLSIVLLVIVGGMSTLVYLKSLK